MSQLSILEFKGEWVRKMVSDAHARGLSFFDIGLVLLDTARELFLAHWQERGKK